MDSLGNSSSAMNGVQQKTPTKRSNKQKKKNNNNNKKEIKVVYISNPMKVKTSASEFRALVQELTGQDAEFPYDSSRFKGYGSDHDGDDDSNNNNNTKGGYDDNNCTDKVGYDEVNDDTLVVVPPPSPPSLLPPPENPNWEEKIVAGEGGERGGSSSIESFEPFDEVFTPQMIESISSFIPSSVYYESPQLDQVVMHYNYVHQ
ncbi:hypothetical protein HN51_039130 [Arachis hypogaea]|uniref:VQ domain-containing protein n=1 Tax=Arachis hypogaea TaxID=3818 RepID=A0A444YHS6_ARAHY|nr:vacuolar protein sorting-associated protein 13-like protein [Arachis ipaensis]XP_025663324.1 vacuolar protein sorting-associated protein 13-like protein [Arachis hypogaea]QHN84596.1 Sigma factor binding protein 1 [Arachis hypogaea]RYR01492.1 hypothetical protein Ahy_B06g080365 [Arachis hypogaea]